jgi:hypothetical protein
MKQCDSLPNYQQEGFLMAKQWFDVSLVQQRIVRVYAEDLEEAREKAEAKVNKRNNKWMAV